MPAEGRLIQPGGTAALSGPTLITELSSMVELDSLATCRTRRAREMHEQDQAICEALGDRAGVAGACGNLGNCYSRTGDYGGGGFLVFSVW